MEVGDGGIPRIKAWFTAALVVGDRTSLASSPSGPRGHGVFPGWGVGLSPFFLWWGSHDGLFGGVVRVKEPGYGMADFRAIDNVIADVQLLPGSCSGPFPKEIPGGLVCGPAFPIVRVPGFGTPRPARK